MVSCRSSQSNHIYNLVRQPLLVAVLLGARDRCYSAKNWPLNFCRQRVSLAGEERLGCAHTLY